MILFQNTGIEFESIKHYRRTFGKEAKRIVEKMPNWVPTEFEGEGHRMRTLVPIAFVIEQ